MPSPVIRTAEPSELELLSALEVRAGQLFHEVDMSAIADHEPDPEGLRHSQEAGRVWVADVDGTIAGYIVATVLDGGAHVEQVSVDPAHGRRGIGRQLIAHVEQWGRSRGCRQTSLTTFRDVPWNGPYYAALGYRELPVTDVGPELRAVMEHEASLPGIDAARRCAMVRTTG